MSVTAGGLVDPTTIKPGNVLACAVCGAEHVYPAQTTIYYVPVGWGTTHTPHDPRTHSRPVCPACVAAGARKEGT